MKVVAPGKLVLTGAYAVLEGAPAIVVAVDRHALADVAAPDDVDVRALHDDAGRKLGLGSSAAAMVASQAARAVARGHDPVDATVRTRLFRGAREAHALQQGGGSGVDVAASVYGGTLRYALEGADVALRGVALPPGIILAAYWSGTSARTSDLRARVDGLRARHPGALAPLRAIAARAADAVDAADAHDFVAAGRDYGRALDALGHAADAPIVPVGFLELSFVAEAEGGAFLPSGAGGGDVGIWLGTRAPSDEFAARAEAGSMRALALSIDPGGVRILSPA